MKPIGLFGGTFDPVHNGHLNIAQAFADEIGLETVIFLPAGEPYHKTAAQTAAAHRLAMVEAAVADYPQFAVSDCDIVRQGATYTFDTVQIFRQQFPNTPLWWLLGSDSLMKLHTWKRWETLVRQINIAVAMREGDSLNKTPAVLHSWLGGALQNGSVRILNTLLYPVSSTQIRSELQQGRFSDGLIPPQVERYIRRHGLYQN
ncbi:nicotinate-nucleotide adenylyltransferase [Neisseria sp. ZJ106]|uniref:Probable nicotinate-nucleotide adenylyltransferase n=1 Tax=Neisseria lisongii TaxID=2912188 RepID=A0ABY7RIY6_9NEIS|nr:nicotinate-nucleotide adenylyltransferase [Neisseria lisongii]MCF7520638.1 nicotinate-nucleotide adenylyltransferase [Neisseria lisongii]WCL71428.1 nicotinate-nucleotide adenylyltransferase [Neisseria lisongii]